MFCLFDCPKTQNSTNSQNHTTKTLIIRQPDHKSEQNDQSNQDMQQIQIQTIEKRSKREGERSYSPDVGWNEDDDGKGAKPGVPHGEEDVTGHVRPGEVPQRHRHHPHRQRQRDQVEKPHLSPSPPPPLDL